MMVPQLVNAGFQVLFHSPPGVLFTFPSQYSALSVTKEYLALRGGPRLFPQDFTCLVVLWILLCRFVFHVRGFHPLRPAFPGPFHLTSRSRPQSEPQHASHPGLGSSRFARRYFGNHFCFLFLRLLRCFSSPGSLHTAIWSLRSPLRYGDWVFPSRVSPFRHPRIYAYLQLPAAFRSLSRLSSALSAKASALRSFLLNLHNSDRSAADRSGGLAGLPAEGLLSCLRNIYGVNVMK